MYGMNDSRIRAVLACSWLFVGPACGDDDNSGEDVFDGAGDSADGTGDVTDAPALAITTDALPDGRVQVAYAAQLEAADAVGTVSWTVSTGALPPGLALGADGAISGLPERSGVYAFEVAADDGASSDMAALSITVPKVLLLSGFEPFGGYAVNSSYEALVPLDGMIVSGLDVHVAELAVVWGDSWDELAGEIDWLHPDAVLATGQAGPEGMRFESRARNIMNGTDNAGVTMTSQPIVAGGLPRLTASYPIDEMKAAMDAGGFTTVVSSDPGDFLCNYVMYRLLDYSLSAAEPPRAFGFIHVPPFPGGGMTIEQITAAHRLGIEALAAWLASGVKARTVVPTIHTAPRYFF
jgi:pyroglutamyl-peptidase